MPYRRLYRFDRSWREKGYAVLAGLDEAGRGPLAGPLVAAAVVLPPLGACRVRRSGLQPDKAWKGLNDSKQISAEERERLFDVISRGSLFYSVAVVDHRVVDELNVLGATFQAMRQALAALGTRPDLVLVDGPRKPAYDLPQEAVVDGDAKSACIAAASVLAKVTRDRLMLEAHARFPQYGFNENKGYGTPAHLEALRRFGPCEIHRRTYAPVQAVLSPGLPFGSS